MKISDEEFEKIYGRKPYKRQVKVKIYWGRIIAAVLILVLVIWLIVKAISGIASLFSDDKESAASSSKASAKSQTSSSESSKSDKKDSSSKTEESKSGKKDLGGSFTVCIDAGHGGNDAGTTDNAGTRYEKDDTLNLALAVRDHLEEQGVNVLMIRDDDTESFLPVRCDMANNSDSDFYVSLHRNSYDGDFGGVEIWVHNAEPEYDTKLAENILDGLEKVGISENRGIHFGYIGNSDVNYHINAQTVMPSCLVELGFLTYDEDNRLFDEKLDEYAESIADNIVKTAKDIGLIDDDGNRLIEGRLISPEKYINIAGAEDEPTPSGGLTTESGAEVYNVQENEYY